jgi:putative ATPase
MVDESPPDLFEARAARDPTTTPLAERMRPETLDDFVGQGHIVGEGRILRRAIESDRIPSMILWGPPGTGKTTLAHIVASHTGSAFETLPAVSSGVRDIRAVVATARDRRRYEQRATVLFIDEIHRFNKSQQDALLPHVEAGVCRLVGATTENPSFEVNAALLSRARVFQLRPLGVPDLVAVMKRALEDETRGLGARGLEASDRLLEALARACEGDARRALGTIELAADMLGDGERVLTPELVGQVLGGRRLRYDKAGEEHYGVVSAFIKSMRASDADAAIYWLARMLESGEDPMFVARRIVIFAAEDVCNADPQALVVANAAAQATHMLGMPECVLPLSQATLYLSLSPKSNAGLVAYGAAKKDVLRHGALPVPPQLRNAVTALMKSTGVGAGYRYPHDLDGGIDPEHTSHLPDALRNAPGGPPTYVHPSDHGWEAQAAERLARARTRPDES